MNNYYTQICQYETLKLAWEKVKKKDSSGGIDNVSVSQFAKNEKENLQHLEVLLTNEQYVPEPYKVFYVKKNKNEKRKLALLSVKDKIVQTAVKIVLEPVLEKNFLNTSYAYRKNKGTEKAIKRLLHIVRQGKRNVVKCDINNFFDEINHKILFEKLNKVLRDKKTLRLIKLIVLTGDVDNTQKWEKREKGTTQGAILSPLLSNFYLQPLDFLCKKNEYAYLRYADDFILLAYSSAQAKAALQKVRHFLSSSLKLQLNDDVQITHTKKGVEFLGITINNTSVSISEEKKEQLKAALTENITLSSFSKTSNFYQSLNGIKNYYAKLLPQQMLEQLDKAMIEALQSFFHQQLQDRKIKTQKQIVKKLEILRFLSETNIARKEEIIKKIAKESYHLPSHETKHTPKTVQKLINKKRNQYEKLESAGKEIIINTPGTYIAKHYNNIVLKQKGKVIHKVNVQNLKTITIISSGVLLSSNAIYHCMKNDIAIDFLNFNGKPYAKLYSPSFTRQQVIQQQALAALNGKAAKYIKKLIIASIKNRVNLIKYFGKYRKTVDEEFAQVFESKMLQMKRVQKKVKELNENDLNLLKEKIFILEAQAAQAYWFMYEKILDEYIVFPGRKTQGAEDTVNVMLNYGYGILYARVWRAVIKANLSPYIGFLHSDKRNAAAFIFDFIEEFRQQAVDRVVASMISKREKIEVKEGVFVGDTKALLAQNITERLNDFEIFRKKRMRLEDIIQQQAEDFAGFLNDEIKTYKPYISKW